MFHHKVLFCVSVTPLWMSGIEAFIHIKRVIFKNVSSLLLAVYRGVTHKSVKTFLKRPSRPLNSFVWYDSSFLYFFVCSIIPKHLARKLLNPTKPNQFFMLCVSFCKHRLTPTKNGSASLCTSPFRSLILIYYLNLKKYQKVVLKNENDWCRERGVSAVLNGIIFI